MLMIKAGKPVDDSIEALLPYLETGDIIIDGGNSNYQDSIRRTQALESRGLRFIGTGVSGGEEGARFGPSIMPGGTAEAWPYVKDIFQGIAAKVEDGTPCCDWVGSDGAGHFVKMVHNGIEYGDMQLISEAYHLLKSILGMNHDQMHTVFADWNQGVLDSYLIEITRDIMAYKDEDDSPLLEAILDSAGQKGTGRWTAITALDLGIPLTLIAEAVLARSLSALKEERLAAAQFLSGPRPSFEGDQAAFVEDVRQALYAAKIMSYTQGYMLMQAAAQEYHWDLNYGNIALMWRGGCIIRSAFLGKIKAAYDHNPALSNLLLDPYFKTEVENTQAAWRRVVAEAVKNGIPVAGHVQCPGVFRWLPLRTAARQPDPGAARLFRRPYLRTHRPATRPVLPHQLDRQRRRRHLQHLQRLIRLMPVFDALLTGGGSTELATQVALEREFAPSPKHRSPFGYHTARKTGWRAPPYHRST